MSEEGVERKLTTILAADVVGYSRLMGEDEAGTLARLKSLSKELVQPKIAGCRGRIVKLMGDGLLAEFPSVVEAVRCAVDIQQDLAGRELDLPDERRIRLRIGVNLGDIIVEGSDIYGDGVHVAARLEGLAEPGGICISSVVHDQVNRRIDVDFTDLGEQELKNIDRPVRVWQWLPEGSRGNVEIKAEPGPLALPDKPSIAVLPFNNMSGDPDQEYFADGIAEDITTNLSRTHWLFVIARNSSFVFKGQAVDIQDVARSRFCGSRVDRPCASLPGLPGGLPRSSPRWSRRPARSHPASPASLPGSLSASALAFAEQELRPARARKW